MKYRLTLEISELENVPHHIIVETDGEPQWSRHGRDLSFNVYGKVKIIEVVGAPTGISEDDDDKTIWQSDWDDLVADHAQFKSVILAGDENGWFLDLGTCDDGHGVTITRVESIDEALDHPYGETVQINFVGHYVDDRPPELGFQLDGKQYYASQQDSWEIDERGLRIGLKEPADETSG